ncbi:MAG TPA: hypothetical protein VK447_19955, partial [Myxococcaceae bacterium]|nr:hypothetical protein [Myxococcaceae bacterium]
RSSTSSRPVTRTRTGAVARAKPDASTLDGLFDDVEPAPDADATRVKSMAEVEASRPQRPPSRTGTPKASAEEVANDATNPRARLSDLEGARGQRAPSRSTPRRPAPKPASRYEPDDAEDSVPDSPDDDDLDSYRRDNPPVRSSNPDVFKPEESLDDVKAFVGSLGSSDKLTLLGAVGVLVVSFLPWVEHFREGESMGYATLGAVASGCAAVVLVTLVMRVRGASRISPALLWLGQLGATSFGTLWCLVFLKLAYDGTKVPALVGIGRVAVSTPASGAYLGLMCMLLALGGALMGLKENRS